MQNHVKNIALAGISLFALIAFSSCSLDTSSQPATPPVDNAANQKQIQDLQNQVKNLQSQIDATNKDKESATPSAAEVTPITINITSPKNKAYFTEEPVKFVGAVSSNTKRIGVKATNLDITQVDDYVLTNYKAGDTTFNYGASAAWNNLKEGTNTYIFTAYSDGGSASTSFTIFYTVGGAEMGKPVIYLYPEKAMNVYVNVKPTDGISKSEPAIKDGWNVRAEPNGILTNLADSKVYPYLFWEGFASHFVTPKEGFVVAKNDVSKFFDEKLATLGLNKQEIADFKDFWTPKLAAKPYYFITFIDKQSLDAYAPLTVSPSPDSIIRVFFDHQGLDKKVTVPEQKLTPGVRKGFALIEWGGRLYP